METRLKVLLGILGVVALFGAGYYSGKGDVKTVTEEKIVYKDQEIRVEYRDRTIVKTKIIAPDGTVTETETDKDVSQNTDSRSTETDKDKIVTVTPDLSKYSLGVKYWLPLNYKIISPESYGAQAVEITVGKRVWGELWVDAGYKLDNSFALGLSFKF